MEDAAVEAAPRAAEELAARHQAETLERELGGQAQVLASTQPEREVVPDPVDVEPLPDSAEPVVAAAPAQEERATEPAELPIYRWFGNG